MSTPRRKSPVQNESPIGDWERRTINPLLPAQHAPRPAAVEATVELLYRAPLWLPNRHVQTIVPSLFARRPAIAFRRERWDTPDGDFIDLDWVRA